LALEFAKYCKEYPLQAEMAAESALYNIIHAQKVNSIVHICNEHILFTKDMYPGSILPSVYLNII
jgi:hypothetical protein